MEAEAERLLSLLDEYASSGHVSQGLTSLIAEAARLLRSAPKEPLNYGPPEGVLHVLHENEWISLYRLVAPHVEGYVYSHETRCRGKIAAVLPYREIGAGLGHEYLLRHEVTPCWGMEPTLSTVTGGASVGMTMDETAEAELKEETGYAVPFDADSTSTESPQRWKRLGFCRASKSSDTRYWLYAVNVTGLEPGEIKGDGTLYDSTAKPEWVNQPALSEDPLAAVMWSRLFLQQ